MAKVITYSRKFPAYHPRKGEMTQFAEKFLIDLKVSFKSKDYLEILYNLNAKNLASGKLSITDLNFFQMTLIAFPDTDGKKHTVRGGKRFNAGDYFSPRVWSGKPYDSPQIIFWYDTPVKKTFDFNIINPTGNIVIKKRIIYRQIGQNIRWHSDIFKLASNDGFLLLTDLLAWFKYPKPFDGQIICWNENVKY